MMSSPLTQHVAPSTMRLVQTFCIAFLPLGAISFTPLSRPHCAFQTVLFSGGDQDESSSSVHHQRLNCGLLISSWTDGVVDNPKAKLFLKKGLACSLLTDLQRKAEASVESSVLQSPCCGPDTEALESMESIDKTLARIRQDANAIDEWLEHHSTDNMNLRVLYIPTAMYALRADSANTPGKQRQRARADGKKRRTQVVEYIQDMFSDEINVVTITLDLDDGSVKQPEGSDNAISDFPKVRPSSDFWIVVS